MSIDSDEQMIDTIVEIGRRASYDPQAALTIIETVKSTKNAEARATAASFLCEISPTIADGCPDLLDHLLDADIRIRFSVANFYAESASVCPELLLGHLNIITRAINSEPNSYIRGALFDILFSLAVQVEAKTIKFEGMHEENAQPRTGDDHSAAAMIIEQAFRQEISHIGGPPVKHDSGGILGVASALADAITMLRWARIVFRFLSSDIEAIRHLSHLCLPAILSLYDNPSTSGLSDAARFLVLNNAAQMRNRANDLAATATEALATDQSPEIRKLVAFELAASTGSRALPRLIQLIENERDEGVSKVIRGVIRQIFRNQPQVEVEDVKAIVHGLSSPNTDVRHFTNEWVRAAMPLGNAVISAMLELAEKDPQARATLCEFFGSLGSPAEG